MSETISVLVPIQLTPEMIDEVMRKNPETSINDMDERHKRLGWMICAWDILLAMSIAKENTEYQRGLNDGLEQAAFTCKLQVKDWSPTENAKYVALETARDIEKAIRAQIKK